MILKSAYKGVGVHQIGTGVLRRMSSAIINTHFDQADRACFAVAQDVEVPSDDIDEEGVDLARQGWCDFKALSRHTSTGIWER